MSIPVVSDAAAMAAALLDVAALIEEAGAAGLAVTCYGDRTRILVTSCAGSARHRAALVAALGELAGAARCRQCDIAGERPSAWLEAAGRAGSTVVEVTTPLAVRSVPGGTVAAGPDGQQAVIASGQQPPPGWRWVTELDDQPGDEDGQRQEAA
jgi:hypothetical protein